MRDISGNPRNRRESLGLPVYRDIEGPQGAPGLGIPYIPLRSRSGPAPSPLRSHSSPLQPQVHPMSRFITIPCSCRPIPCRPPLSDLRSPICHPRRATRPTRPDPSSFHPILWDSLQWDGMRTGHEFCGGRITHTTTRRDRSTRFTRTHGHILHIASHIKSSAASERVKEP